MDDFIDTIEYVLRLPEVLRRSGLRRSTMYKLIHEDKFPRPIYLGARCVGWRAGEIAEWIRSRPRTGIQ